MSAGLTAVMLDVQAINPTAAGGLSVFPTGMAPNNTNSLQFRPNKDRDNQVLAKVGPDGATAGSP